MTFKRVIIAYIIDIINPKTLKADDGKQPNDKQ